MLPPTISLSVYFFLYIPIFLFYYKSIKVYIFILYIFCVFYLLCIDILNHTLYSITILNWVLNVYYTLILKFYITHFLCITLDSVQHFIIRFYPYIHNKAWFYIMIILSYDVPDVTTHLLYIWPHVKIYMIS